MAEDLVIQAIQHAIEASPRSVDLRLHLAGLLIADGRSAEARGQLEVVRAMEPDEPRLAELDARAAAAVQDASSPDATVPDVPPSDPTAPDLSPSDPTAPDESLSASAAAGQFDWDNAEAQVGDIVAPGFVEDDGTGTDDRLPLDVEPLAEAESEEWQVEAPKTTLADVGGLEAVKKRLDASFLVPMKNPELQRLYRKSLRGGLLLYGPPGCGKTFLARAIAGELGAGFLTASASDLLGAYIGESEKAITTLFEKARASAPCVLFLDEIDGIGGKRSSMSRSPWLRNIINQLLTEMDGVGGGNEGVYILAATNQPWDVDPALRRPGRLDRTLLVLPPDEPARRAIFSVYLRDRPIEGINLAQLARRTEQLSGADISYICELASEAAMMDSVASGTARMIRMADFEEPLATIRPSTTSWLDSARTVVNYGTDDGTFDELRAYLKRAKR